MTKLNNEFIINTYLKKGVLVMGTTLEFKDPDEVRGIIALQGDTLRSFAKRVGISETSLNRYLFKTKRLRPTTAKKISDGLNAKVGDIFLL